MQNILIVILIQDMSRKYGESKYCSRPLHIIILLTSVGFTFQIECTACFTPLLRFTHLWASQITNFKGALN